MSSRERADAQIQYSLLIDRRSAHPFLLGTRSETDRGRERPPFTSKKSPSSGPGSPGRPEGPLDLCVDGEAPVQTGFCLLTPGVPCCGVLAAGTGMGRFLRRSRLGDQTVAAGVRTADQRLRLGRPGELCKSARGWGSARTSLLCVFVGAACSRLLTAVIRGHPRSSAAEKHRRKADKGVGSIGKATAGRTSRRLHSSAVPPPGVAWGRCSECACLGPIPGTLNWNVCG